MADDAHQSDFLKVLQKPHPARFWTLLLYQVGAVLLVFPAYHYFITTPEALADFNEDIAPFYSSPLTDFLNWGWTGSLGGIAIFLLVALLLRHYLIDIALMLMLVFFANLLCRLWMITVLPLTSFVVIAGVVSGIVLILLAIGGRPMAGISSVVLFFRR